MASSGAQGGKKNKKVSDWEITLLVTVAQWEKNPRLKL